MGMVEVTPKSQRHQDNQNKEQIADQRRRCQVKQGACANCSQQNTGIDQVLTLEDHRLLRNLAGQFAEGHHRPGEGDAADKHRQRGNDE